MNDTNFSVTNVAFAYYRQYPQGYTRSMNNRGMHGLTLILSGELEMIFPHRTITARAGNLLLQRQGDSYLLRASKAEGAEYIVISYQAEPANVLFDLLPDRLFITDHPSRFHNAFEAAARIHASYGICHETLLRAMVQEILCNIIRENYPLLLSREKNPVAFAKRYIEEFYGNDLSADNIAAVVGVSPSYLRTLFQKSEGESPIHYLNRIRIERAKEMISSGMFRLDEIATTCGFQNVYYFNRVFKKFTGVPPGKY